MEASYIMLDIYIYNFKSIKELELKLEPLTILLGPPASGKSNILEAIGFMGYLSKLFHTSIVNNEYNVNNINLITNLHLQYNLRLPSSPQPSTQLEQLFKNYAINQDLIIRVTRGERYDEIKLYYEGGIPIIRINNTPIQFQSLLQSQIPNITLSLYIVSYLYSYERYQLNTHFFNSIQTRRDNPKTILAESGTNILQVKSLIADVIRELNEAIYNNLEEKIELKLSKDRIVIYDYDVEIENYNNISDSLLRMLYYLAAIKTSIYFVKKYGLEKRFILMLEEPEAHVFPYLLSLLADHIKEAIDILYVIVSTHNPLFVSLLWDRVKDVKTYYVFRDSDGNTMAKSISNEKLAEKYISSIDLIGYTPSMVAEYFEE